MRVTNLALLFLLPAIISAWEYNNPYRMAVGNAVMQDWIDQPIDHFNYYSKATFKQRYYVLSDFYTVGGPAYLYICGEAECKGISNVSSLAEMAK